jgi:hypothetical protein
MESKLDNVLGKIIEHGDQLGRHDEQLGTLRDRVTTIEASRPKNVPAWVAAVAAGMATVVAVVALFIR